MRVLVVSHEASRSGAPRVAALVARCLDQQGHEVEIVSRTRGPLLSDFAAVAPTTVEFGTRVRRRVRAVGRFRPLAWWLDTLVAAATIVRHRPDVVYVNSTAAAGYLRPARWLRRRRILHVHESGEVASGFLAGERAVEDARTAQLIGCSPSVRTELARVLECADSEVTMLPSVPDDDRVRTGRSLDAGLPRTAAELIVGCCGSAEPRKGADLWADIAAAVHRRLPDRRVRFVWVGDLPGAAPSSGPDVEFVGGRENPYPVMASFDVAALPSRDDPFPLVVLEAMLLGKPVVAFDVGAVAEQIGATGRIVEAENVEAFAEAVAELLADDALRSELGEAARQRAEDQFSTAAFCRGLALLLADCVLAHSSGRAITVPSS